MSKTKAVGNELELLGRSVAFSQECRSQWDLSGIDAAVRSEYVVGVLTLFMVDVKQRMAKLAKELIQKNIPVLPDDNCSVRSTVAPVPYYGVWLPHLIVNGEGSDKPDITICLWNDDDRSDRKGMESAGEWKFEFDISTECICGSGIEMFSGLERWEDVALIIERICISEANLTGKNPFASMILTACR